MKFGSSSAWSFGKTTKGRMEKCDIQTNPGPGSYQANSVTNKAPNWK